jgi:hypothetical protein
MKVMATFSHASSSGRKELERRASAQVGPGYDPKSFGIAKIRGIAAGQCKAVPDQRHRTGTQLEARVALGVEAVTDERNAERLRATSVRVARQG